MVDVLHNLTEEYILNQRDIEQFRINGHVLLRNVASLEEVDTYRPAIVRSVRSLNKENRPLEKRETYGKAFLQTFNLWKHDDAVAEFVLASRFANIAATLLGVSKVRLYHDQALFKEPGGGHTPWHQDAVYWPLDGRLSLTMWMPLVDITSDMGGMCFASGTHQGPLCNATISDQSDEHFARLIDEQAYNIVDPVKMLRGDATFHAGWTAHRALPNTSQITREAMTIIWYADGITVREPTRNQESDLYSWLPGLAPGDLAATELNPVLPR